MSKYTVGGNSKLLGMKREDELVARRDNSGKLRFYINGYRVTRSRAEEWLGMYGWT